MNPVMSDESLIVAEMQLLQEEWRYHRVCGEKLQEDVSSLLWTREWHTSPVLRYFQVLFCRDFYTP